MSLIQNSERIVAEKSNGVVPKTTVPIGTGIVTSQTGVRLVCAADIEAQSIEWLWPNRYALGKLAINCGDPGVGKSFQSLDAISRVTTGAPWPDGSGNAPLGEALLLACEDGVADTIIPRLNAMGADLKRVFIVEGTQEIDGGGKKVERALRFDLDLDKVRAVFVQHPEIKVFVVDPISEYLGKIDSHKSDQVRQVLGPLCKLAEEFSVAIIGIAHMSKSGSGKAIYRAMGSLAFVAAARTAFGFFHDQEQPGRMLMLPIKANIAKRAPGLAYHIADEGRLVWEEGTINMTADDAMAEPDKRQKRGGTNQQERCEAWLIEQLQDGPVESKELTDSAKAAGFAFATFRRAKDKLRDDGALRNAKASGKTGQWFVSLFDHMRSSKNNEQVERDEQHERIDWGEDAQGAHVVQEYQDVHGAQEEDDSF